MNINEIIIKGAREHNLKNVNLVIPRNKLIVMTGLSGSGKSSLAFDTIYAEGQRRYVESLSSYARQFLGQMEKPDVDYIEGLSPAISIDQKTTSRNPRSTVGTVTEIHDYLRLMFARIGVPHCPKCGKPIRQQTVDQIVDQIMALPERTRLMILAPVVRGRKGEFVKLMEDMTRQGYVRARIDGTLCELADPPRLVKNVKHTIEVVIDRLIVRPEIQQRLTDSLETAMKLAEGLVIASVVDGEDTLFSQNYACPDCGVSIGELAPRMFSFNNPYGACPTCSGLGVLMKIDRSPAGTARRWIPWPTPTLRRFQSSTAFRWTRRSATCPRPPWTYCSMAPGARRSGSNTPGATAAVPSPRPSRASSPTSNGATAKPAPRP